MKNSDSIDLFSTYKDLFKEVHKANFLSDEKSFSDAIAKLHPDIILKTYLKEKDTEDFDIQSFVNQYFEFQKATKTQLENKSLKIEEYIKSLWEELERQPDDIKKNRSSKISLPFPYIVPGGRFNEIYYWDSYFTMLGLVIHGKHDLAESMIKNFKYFIDQFGHIPNGNRSYFLSRSQPPFYSLMIKLLVKLKGTQIINEYLPSLVKEYNFWMKGLSETQADSQTERVVKLTESEFLNTYSDTKDIPREEMLRTDWALINFREDYHDNLYKNIRAACESGWDFSSRWFEDKDKTHSIQTCDIIPVDLNCLLWHLEKLISECYHQLEKTELSLNYAILANQRKKAIIKYCWSEEEKFFMDYNWKKKERTKTYSLAGAFPLFFKLADKEQAAHVAEHIKNDFLHKGGLTTTTTTSEHQWDAPNGWAPLQWITIKGLIYYNFNDIAKQASDAWCDMINKIYEKEKRIFEKYDVVNASANLNSGEYENQDGFGWTNGVYIALKQLKFPKEQKTTSS